MSGFVPMGYDVKDRKIVINESEANTVRMIFERFVALGSASKLARALQAEGVLAIQTYPKSAPALQFLRRAEKTALLRRMEDMAFSRGYCSRG